MNNLFYGHNQIVGSNVITIANLTYSSSYSIFDIATQVEVNGFSFNPNGNRLFSADDNDLYHTDYTARFNLTYQDVDSVVRKSIIVGGHTTTTMSYNGKNFYTSVVSRVVRWHELSIAYDISSADPNPTSFTMPNMGPTVIIYDISISDDGTYLACAASDGTYSYSLTTPHDITTVVFISKYTTQTHYGAQWANDGHTYLYLIDTPRLLVEATLATPYNPFSVTSTINKNISAQSPNGFGLFLMDSTQIGVCDLSSKSRIDVYDL